MKTKKAMKKITHIGMAALVAMGMLGTSCNKAESPEIETPETQKENIVTLTTTVGFAADGTKALTAEGVKTFAEGEKMVLRYKNTKGDWVKAVSNALEAGDIAAGSKSATFTFTLTNPDKTKTVDYIYPAAIVNELGNMDEAALFGSQDGTLNKIASTFDYSRKISAWDGENLPSLTLENQLAILAITLTNADGSSDITSSITGLTLSDGTKTYNVTREAVAGPIYVAIFPTEDATIDITATNGTKNYTKTLTGKTYAKGNGYPVSWKMAKLTDLSSISGTEYTVQDGEVLTGTLASKVKISIAAPVAPATTTTVTLKDADINGSGTWTDGDYAGITCEGNATIILEGDNTVTGFNDSYPGIYVPAGNTLTIQGSGSLAATGGGSYSGGAGIGGGVGSCGNIVINGGNITATGSMNAAGIGNGYYGTCGAITISGGTITATGGDYAAGIGGGNHGTCGAITISGGTVEATGGASAAGIGGGRNNGACGTITITSGVTSVTATKGSYAPNSIGSGDGGAVITVTIGGTEYASGISQSPYEYSAPPTLTLTSPTVGQVIGSDGKNYAADASLPTGVTKVAMIAYVSGSNGLAIALADESGSMNWATAKSTCEAKTPAFTGGTWKLPSLDEWKNMLTYDGDSYWNNNLQTALSTAGGNSLQEWMYYWSSTDYVSDNTQACDVEFQSGYANFSNQSKTYTSGMLVRAVLAF